MDLNGDSKSTVTDTESIYPAHFYSQYYTTFICLSINIPIYILPRSYIDHVPAHISHRIDILTIIRDLCKAKGRPHTPPMSHFYTRTMPPMVNSFSFVLVGAYICRVQPRRSRELIWPALQGSELPDNSRIFQGR
jgi:hypothetical protein